jgi:predicted ATP-grasp superfamily ATP-dependent carboligase
MDPESTLYGGADFSSPLQAKLCDWFKSPRLTSVFQISSPKRDHEQFKEDIIKAVLEVGIDVVLPTGTIETDYLSFYYKEIIQRCTVILPVMEYDKQLQATDKWLTFCLCRETSVPSPKTALVDTLENLPTIARTEEFKFPIVLKLRRSFAAEGIRFFQTFAELETFSRNDTKNKTDFDPKTWIIQEHIDGELHDVTSCSWQGDVYSILSQRRLMTWYDFGGGGIINMTTDEPIIKQYASEMIKQLGWSGILEFDFIRAKGNDYYLIECNPKIWGTTQLTTDAGLNMPKQAIDLYTGKKSSPKFDYQTGFLYRWIFPYCIASWFNRPMTPANILRRMRMTFRKHNCKRSRANIRREYIRHLVGCTIYRTKI